MRKLKNAMYAFGMLIGVASVVGYIDETKKRRERKARRAAKRKKR